MFHQDKKLERLVPPRELCQKIPAGKFADSALAWQSTMFLSSMPPKLVWEVKPRSECFGHEDAPAPTLEEIMEAIDQSFDANLTATFNLGQWVVEYRHYPKKGIGSDNFNPATAALKLWFDVEGIK